MLQDKQFKDKCQCVLKIEIEAELYGNYYSNSKFCSVFNCYGKIGK